jgi:hypothetical protein
MNYAPDQIWLVPLRGAATSRHDWMTMTPLPQHVRHRLHGVLIRGDYKAFARKAEPCRTSEGYL